MECVSTILTGYRRAKCSCEAGCLDEKARARATFAVPTIRRLMPVVWIPRQKLCARKWRIRKRDIHRPPGSHSNGCERSFRASAVVCGARLPT